MSNQQTTRGQPATSSRQLASHQQTMARQQTWIVGLGSPHGDDQIGWRVAEELAASELAVGEWAQQVALRKAASPLDLLDWLEPGLDLILCDACRGVGRPGEIGRWEWPAAELPASGWSGTHDFSLPAVLALAQRLGRLPARVVIWGVEAAGCGTGDRLSPAGRAAVSLVVQEILQELKLPVTRQEPPCTSTP